MPPMGKGDLVSLLRNFWVIANMCVRDKVKYGQGTACKGLDLLAQAFPNLFAVLYSYLVLRRMWVYGGICKYVDYLRGPFGVCATPPVNRADTSQDELSGIRLFESKCRVSFYGIGDVLFRTAQGKFEASTRIRGKASGFVYWRA